MSVGMQVFWTNMSWLIAAMTLVLLAYLKTESLHSFWFLGVYWLGHSHVVTTSKEGTSK
jgi:hypothetical protein